MTILDKLTALLDKSVLVRTFHCGTLVVETIGSLKDDVEQYQVSVKNSNTYFRLQDVKEVQQYTDNIVDGYIDVNLL